MTDDLLEPVMFDRRTPWPVFAAGMCLWTVALGVTAVVVAADRLATRFLNGGN